MAYRCHKLSDQEGKIIQRGNSYIMGRSIRESRLLFLSRIQSPETWILFRLNLSRAETEPMLTWHASRLLLIANASFADL